jgi:hypothetical protein
MQKHDMQLLERNNRIEKFLKKNKEIEPETIDHLVTVLSVIMEGNMDTDAYGRCIDYVKEWVMYRSQFVRDLVRLN